MPSPAVEATCDGAVAVPRAGKPCGKAGSMSRLCSKGSILPLDFLSTKLVINSQGDRKGTPLQYTNATALAYIVGAYPCGRPGGSRCMALLAVGGLIAAMAYPCGRPGGSRCSQRGLLA